jgi:predicted amidohydrolase
LGARGELFNTAIALSPQGELAASYRKVFPWRPYEPFDAGDRFVTFDLPGIGRAGFSICYDAWFPEVTRHLAWMGAEVVLNLVKTTTCDRAQEVVLARANAIVNQVFVVSVNCAGPIGTGQSLIVDPEGLVRTTTSGAESTILTDVLDLEHVARVRRYGTAGLTRMWDQFQPEDQPLSLPLYGGTIYPERWNPDRQRRTEAPEGEDQTD